MNPHERQRLADALSGRYAIERELGQGGMAVVYRARDLKHDRLVAIKVLKPALAHAARAEAARAGARRGARAAARGASARDQSVSRSDAGASEA
ncbi:MAG: hypothetical protein WD773_07915 [Gemmatimonadales bacterium]